MEAIRHLLDRLFDVSAFGIIVSSIVAATLLTTVVGFTSGAYSIANPPIYISVIDTRLLTASFISSFAFLAIISFVYASKATTDIYTPLRKKLSGDWKIKYDVHYYDSQGKFQKDNRTQLCTIGIDGVTGKTFLRIKEAESRYFEAKAVRVDDISINPNLAPKRLTFYCILNVIVQVGFRDSIEDGSVIKDASGHMSFAIFGMLELPDDSDVEPINKMTGCWYDLDGKYSGFAKRIAEKVSGVTPVDPPVLKESLTFERVKRGE